MLAGVSQCLVDELSTRLMLLLVLGMNVAAGPKLAAAVTNAGGCTS